MTGDRPHSRRLCGAAPPDKIDCTERHTDRNRSALNLWPPPPEYLKVMLLIPCPAPGAAPGAVSSSLFSLPVRSAPANFPHAESEPAPVRSIRRAGTLVFDCDSTLVSIEGIEHLARGHRREIEALTEAAMQGHVALEQVYGRRLALVRPDRAALEALGQAYIHALVPDARAVISALHAEGVVVRILSGGLRPSVIALAHSLGIADDHVAAVDVSFDDTGEYAGYDTASPLARSGGKRDIILQWRRLVPAPLMIVGDGATDLEAADVADAFVAYAGVVDRPEITNAADAVVRSHSLAPILPLALGGEAPRDSAHRSLFERGLAMMDSTTRHQLSLNRGESA